MSIKIKDDARASSRYIYVPPSAEEQYAEYRRLKTLFDAYIASHRLDPSLIHVDETLICQLLVRIDKRKDYFRIYHDDTYMSEIKEAALTAYWLIRFKPFTLVTADPAEESDNREINEGFGAFLMLSAVKEHTRRQGGTLMLSRDYVRRLMYGLKYWDISKEAMMLIAETLCEISRPQSN